MRWSSKERGGRPASGTVASRVVPGRDGRPCGDAVTGGTDWLAVADGVGSRPPHELASHAATAAVASVMAVPGSSGPANLEKAVTAAWAAVVDVARFSVDQPVATTLTVLWASPPRRDASRAVLVGWLGDSPAGWWGPEGEIRQVTNPHRPPGGSRRQVSRLLCADRQPEPQWLWFEVPPRSWLWAGSDGVAVAEGLVRARSTDLSPWTDGASDDAAIVVVAL
jgi:hypothetical protein